jgi:tetratricopeptide (TPR) repeat protein
MRALRLFAHRGALVLILTLLTLPGAEAARETVVGISEKAYEALEEAQLLIEEENWAGARALLEQLREKKLSSYEEAHTLNLIAYTWYEEGDLATAIARYEEALALEELPESMQVNLLMSLGQINLSAEDYVKAERYLRQLMTIPDQDKPTTRVLLAASLMGQQKYQEALAPLRQAIDEELAAGNNPRENWLSLMSSVYYELNDFPRMRDTVEMLVTLYPRESYLMNLAALHGQLGDQERQLALVESLLDDNRLHQPSHLRLVANLFLGEEQPYKAAVLLDRELAAGRLEKNVSILELLSQAWLLSNEYERAIAPLEEAAEMSESGELYLRLARLHMDAYRFEEAAAAASAALDKGGLRREGQAWLLRGMAEVELKKFSDARKRFRKAANYDDTAKYAGQWLSYVDSEAERQAAIN